MSNIQNSNYIYDMYGKTIGVKANTKQAEEVKKENSSAATVNYNGQEWVTLDGKVDLSQGKTISEFSVMDVSKLFIQGNLTLEELKKWISANGAKLNETSDTGYNIRVSFEYESKTYNLSTTTEAAKSQLDKVISKDSTFDVSEIKEGSGRDLLGYQMSVATEVFALQYFGYDVPNQLGLLALNREEITYVAEHPEIFHYGNIEMYFDENDSNDLVGLDLYWDDYMSEYLDKQSEKMKTNYTQTFDTEGNMLYHASGQVNDAFDEMPDVKNTYKYGKGQYDMFGNGNPPGPDGSLPTGIDGIYVKQNKDCITVYYYDKTTGDYKTYDHANGADLPTIIAGFNSKIFVNAYVQGHGFGLSAYTGELELYSALRLGYTKTTRDGYELYEKDGKYYTYDNNVWIKNRTMRDAFGGVEEYESQLFTPYVPDTSVYSYEYDVESVNNSGIVYATTVPTGSYTQADVRREKEKALDEFEARIKEGKLRQTNAGATTTVDSPIVNVDIDSEGNVTFGKKFENALREYIRKGVESMEAEWNDVERRHQLLDVQGLLPYSPARAFGSQYVYNLIFDQNKETFFETPLDPTDYFNKLRSYLNDESKFQQLVDNFLSKVGAQDGSVSLEDYYDNLSMYLTSDAIEQGEYKKGTGIFHRAQYFEQAAKIESFISEANAKASELYPSEYNPYTNWDSLRTSLSGDGGWSGDESYSHPGFLRSDFLISNYVDQDFWDCDPIKLAAGIEDGDANSVIVEKLKTILERLESNVPDDISGGFGVLEYDVVELEQYLLGNNPEGINYYAMAAKKYDAKVKEDIRAQEYLEKVSHTYGSEFEYDSSIKISTLVTVNNSEPINRDLPMEISDFIENITKPLYDKWYKKTDPKQFDYFTPANMGWNDVDSTGYAKCAYAWKNESDRQQCFKEFDALVPQILEKYGDVLTSLTFDGERFIFSVEGTDGEKFDPMVGGVSSGDLNHNGTPGTGTYAATVNVLMDNWVGEGVPPRSNYYVQGYCQACTDKPVTYIEPTVYESNPPKELPVDNDGGTIVKTPWDGVLVSTTGKVYIWDEIGQQYIKGGGQGYTTGYLDVLQGDVSGLSFRSDETTMDILISLVWGYNRTSSDNLFEKDGKFYMIDQGRLHLWYKDIVNLVETDVFYEVDASTGIRKENKAEDTTETPEDTPETPKDTPAGLRTTTTVSGNEKAGGASETTTPKTTETKTNTTETPKTHNTEETKQMEQAEAEKAKAEAEKAKADAEKAKADAEKAKADAERAKAEAEKAKAEAAKIQAETERVKAEAEIAKAEAERAKAEAEKAKAEAEKAKADAEKAKAEAERIKAETAKAQAEAEKAKADAERAKAEAEKAKADAERAKAEAEKAKAEASANAGAKGIEDTPPELPVGGLEGEEPVPPAEEEPVTGNESEPPVEGNAPAAQSRVLFVDEPETEEIEPETEEIEPETEEIEPETEEIEPETGDVEPENTEIDANAGAKGIEDILPELPVDGLEGEEPVPPAEEEPVTGNESEPPVEGNAPAAQSRVLFDDEPETEETEPETEYVEPENAPATGGTSNPEVKPDVNEEAVVSDKPAENTQAETTPNESSKGIFETEPEVKIPTGNDYTAQEPSVVLTADQYRQKAKEEASKKVGLVYDDKTGTFSQYYAATQQKFLWIWNLYTNSFEVFTESEASQKENDDSFDSIRVLRAAVRQRLNFTSDPKICTDDEGNFYDYNKDTGKFEQRK